MVFLLIRSSLVRRTLLLVLGVSLVVGLLAHGIVGHLAERFETQRARERIEALLAVVEPSASAACFVGDRRLAEETARGLLNSPILAAVEIRGGEGVLALEHRTNWTPGAFEITHSVRSPFIANEVVGEIRISPDKAEIARVVSRYALLLRILVLVITAVVGGALALTVTRSVVAPITLMSDRLNALDAAQGMRLSMPPGHAADEIGRLASNINQALKAVEDRHRLEQEVQQAHAQKISSLGSLAGGVAHDFNNMLAGIMGHADLLLAGEQDPRRQKRINAILAAAKRSSELTSKLLAFGRRGKNRKESVDLAAAVKECLALIQPSMHPDLEVFTRLEDGLCVDGDPSQLQQVLVNLCINAVEAMGGKGTLTITTRTLELKAAQATDRSLTPGTHVELSIADTGAGMNDETLQRIFEPFFTTKTTKDHMGTGLGLPTVLGIVEGHQGAVEVKSRVGAGTTFKIYLPIGVLSPERPQLERRTNGGRGVVLVVEDEPSLRDLARSALESLGYGVETAEDGLAGVALFRAWHPRLRAVLLDMKMPNMGGLEAFGQMQQIDPTVPVIICTGYGENEEVQQILSGGGAGLLPKPYRVAQLADALEQVEAKVYTAGLRP